MPSNMMTLKELAKKSGVLAITVERNYEKVPGYVIENGNAYFPKGSRYPYNLRGSNISGSYGQIKAILRAIRDSQYIDAAMLHIEPGEFDSLIEELHEEKYIKRNRSSNPYGCNRYNLAVRGIAFVDNMEKVDRKIPKIISTADTVVTAISLGLKAIGLS